MASVFKKRVARLVPVGVMALCLMLYLATGDGAWAKGKGLAEEGAAPASKTSAGGAPEAAHGTPGKFEVNDPQGSQGVGEHGGGGHGSEAHEPSNPFESHHGTWINPIARGVFGQDAPREVEHNGEQGFTNVQNDFFILALMLMVLLAVVAISGARRLKLRPEGKPNSLPNIVEAAAEGYQNYLVGIMGRELAVKYTPLIASFFFAILFFNYAGLIPGLMSPTANPNVPFALSIVGFFCVHIIAIREAGVKSWLSHFVGEPLWMAPLNIPLHIIGELVKPVSLAFRLLGNVFGEEIVIAQLALLGIGIATALHIPFIGIPLQLPMLFLSVFFGALQALVFSTLLAIYISILCTHHAHDEHGHVPGHEHGHGGQVEHARVTGREQVVARATESPVA